VIARNAIIVQHDVIRFATADSKDPLSLQRELANLTIDLDLKIGGRNVPHCLMTYWRAIVTGALDCPATVSTSGTLLAGVIPLGTIAFT